jgi:hypothetical protein
MLGFISLPSFEQSNGDTLCQCIHRHYDTSPEIFISFVSEMACITQIWCCIHLYMYVSLFILWTHLSLEDCTTYDEDSFFFPPYPLYDLVRTLRQRSSTCGGRCNSIQFEERCAPCQCYACGIGFVMNLQCRRFIVHIRVQLIVEVE